jgi:PKD repeat protein
MTRFVTASASLVLVALLGVACAVQQAGSAPALAGPSGLAQSMTVTATPDLLTQDGRSTSAISVLAIDANGRPAVGVPLRLDMVVGGVLVDFGILSARNIVTGTDGRATTVYTAPPPPPAAANSGTNSVGIRATALGNDGQGSLGFGATIRLMPPGVILPPAGTPTAKFTFSPASPLMGKAVNFDASGSSLPAGDSGSITSYVWTFGDGTSGSGAVTTHTFLSAASFSVTLTVTTDRSVSASTTQAVTVGAPAPLAASFTSSPSAPAINEVVVFDASKSTTGEGEFITSWAWNFGDDTGIVKGSSRIQSHAFPRAGTFTVNLVVTDSLGRTASASGQVTVK